MAKRRRLRIDRVIIALTALILLIYVLFLSIKGIISLFDKDNEINQKDTEVVDNTAVNEEDMVTIIIDPGHGGYDGGTTNGVLYEKNVVLKISKRIKEQLELEEGVRVILTRETDVALGDNKDEDLINRAKFSDTYNASYFVSIHVNAFENNSVKGFEIYQKDEDSNTLARYVQQELKALNLTDDRGIFDHSGIVVLKRNSAKSILVETGYISGEDYSYLKNDEELMNIADAIARGIVHQLESDKK